VSESPQPSAVGVVLAAGMGTRVGADGNKAYLPVAGRTMMSWSLSALMAAPEVGRAVLVYRRGERDLAQHTVEHELPSATVEFVEGGETRHGSELNVLRYLASDIESGSVDIVVIHDAARPVAGSEMFGTAVSVAREHGGAIPALPIEDVVKTAADGRPTLLPTNGSLVGVQTPQAFRAAPLLAAYRAALTAGFEGTDTSSCVEAFGDVDVRIFGGERRNLKVTYAGDVAVADRLLSGRAGPAGGWR
jgi:2-C-methyl-D-erythritol 4-phosphate cytidylyltransferase